MVDTAVLGHMMSIFGDASRFHALHGLSVTLHAHIAFSASPCSIFSCTLFFYSGIASFSLPAFGLIRPGPVAHVPELVSATQYYYPSFTIYVSPLFYSVVYTLRIYPCPFGGLIICVLFFLFSDNPPRSFQRPLGNHLVPSCIFVIIISHHHCSLSNPTVYLDSHVVQTLCCETS